MITLLDGVFLVESFFSFNTLNVLCHSFVAYKDSVENYTDSLMEFPLYVTIWVFLAVSKILFLAFEILIIMLLGVTLF